MIKINNYSYEKFHDKDCFAILGNSLLKVKIVGVDKNNHIDIKNENAMMGFNLITDEGLEFFAFPENIYESVDEFLVDKFSQVEEKNKEYNKIQKQNHNQNYNLGDSVFVFDNIDANIYAGYITTIYLYSNVKEVRYKIKTTTKLNNGKYLEIDTTENNIFKSKDDILEFIRNFKVY